MTGYRIPAKALNFHDKKKPHLEMYNQPELKLQAKSKKDTQFVGKKLPFNSFDFLNTLPNLPGIYRMEDQYGNLLYVGKSVDLKKRLSSYFRDEKKLAPRIRLMVRQISNIEITVTRNESEALLLENNLIKSLKPKYNILYRDDKSYPYVAFSKHEFPRLHFYRGNAKGGGKYFGPFSNSRAVRESLNLLQKVFKLRTCENSVFSNRSRPCLLYQIKRCSGPCVDRISPMGYKESVDNAQMFLSGKQNQVINKLERNMETASENEKFEMAASFRDQIFALQQIRENQYVATTGLSLDADIIAVLKSSGVICVNVVSIRNGDHRGDKSFFPSVADPISEEDALNAFLGQRYIGNEVPSKIIINRRISVTPLQILLTEQVGRKISFIRNPIGRKRVWLEMAIKNAEIALGQRLNLQVNQERRLAALNASLNFKESVKRIECFDISHMQGEATVASCVVYDDCSIQSSQYRRFNIKDITPGDDYAAMSQVIRRRYSRILREEGKIPDLIIIDGGRGQLMIAKKVLSELGMNNVLMIGVSKGPDRKVGHEKILFPEDRPEISLSQSDPGFHLIQEIRDEAHRFAIRGHRGQRKKTRIKSSLDGVEGIGRKKRQRLIARFGGIKEIMGASLEELQSVEGISKLLAKKIHDELH